MKSLPKDIALPTAEEMIEHLDAQEKQVRRMNFQGLFNLEVQGRRMETAKAKEKFEDAAAIEDEIEKTELAIEGNKEYLEEIEKMRKLI